MRKQLLGLDAESCNASAFAKAANAGRCGSGVFADNAQIEKHQRKPCRRQTITKRNARNSRKESIMFYAIVLLFAFMFFYYLGVLFVDVMDAKKIRKHRENIEREIRKIRDEE